MLDFERELADLRGEIEEARRVKPCADVGGKFDLLLAKRLQREFPSLGVHALDHHDAVRQVKIGGRPKSPDIVISGSRMDDPHNAKTWRMLIEASTSRPSTIAKPWSDGAKYAPGRPELKASGVSVVFVSLYPVPMAEIRDQGQGIYETSRDKVREAGKGKPLGPLDVRWSLGAFLGPPGNQNAWFWIEREPGVTDPIFGGDLLPKDATGGLKVTSETLPSSTVFLFLVSRLLGTVCACTDISDLRLVWPVPQGISAATSLACMAIRHPPNGPPNAAQPESG